MTASYLCNEFLDEVDRDIYKRMAEESPRRYAVAGLGEWGTSEGLIFENWVVEAFDKTKIGGDDDWKYKHVFGLDYGYTNHPTAFIAMAVNPIDKIIYVYDEHYETRMLNNDIAAMLVKKVIIKNELLRIAQNRKATTI